MTDNRYEEYTSAFENAPFVYYGQIRRNCEIYSTEANWHENFELQICTGGCGSVLLDGERVSFSEGDCVAVSPNVIHHTGTEEDLLYSCIIFDTEFARAAGIDPRSLCFEKKFKDAQVLDIVGQIDAAYKCTDDPCRTARLRMLALALLIALRERHASECGKGTAAAYPRVREAINYVKQHYSEHISLEAVAKSLYVNKYVLARQFKAATNTTLIEYANRYRCEMARRMICDGATVSEALHACGFNNA